MQTVFLCLQIPDGYVPVGLGTPFEGSYIVQVATGDDGYFVLKDGRKFSLPKKAYIFGSKVHVEDARTGKWL